MDVVEDFHGTKVSDPYRWLENYKSQEVLKWVDNQNDATNSYLDKYSQRKELKKKLTSFYNFEKYSLPVKEGEFYYFHKNNGLQNQPIFYRSKSLDMSKSEVIIDPNNLCEEGTVALTDVSFSKDGSLMAFAVSYNGSDWQEIRIMNMETKEIYPDLLKWAKFCDITWKPDNTGFYYDRYLDPHTIPPEEESHHNKIYFHAVGTEQEKDELIYEIEGKTEHWFTAKHSDDGEYLIIHVFNGTEPENRVHYKKLDNPNKTIFLIDEPKSSYEFLGNKGPIFYFLTKDNAPNSKVIAIDINKPDRENWKDIIKEDAHNIEFVKIINNYFVICSTVDACNQLQVYDLTGKLINKIPLPKYVTVSDISGKKCDTKMLIALESFLHPTKILEYDFGQKELTTVLESKLSFNSDEYETTQVFYPSKDGTKIPMFLTYKKGLNLNGKNPVMLYSYGGYSVSLTPGFLPAQQLWLQSGGIYAVANIRGGGEYGDGWHKSAILENRQTSFDDFISAAEWLIKNKYSNADRIAIMGASNGGLLVATCIVQRPDLFGAGISLVPVTDMLRFHHFTVGRFWTTEFGNAELNPEHFSFMYKYSPLHNVKEGTEYPPILITTADTDDRVVPLHAYKFAATLQAAQKGKNPILLRVDKNAGHGLGKPISKIIDEEADIYTLLYKEFDMFP